MDEPEEAKYYNDHIALRCAWLGYIAWRLRRRLPVRSQELGEQEQEQEAT